MMIKRLIILLFFLFDGYFIIGQTDVVELSSSLFEKHQQINLPKLNGWEFKEGNDPSWAGVDLNTTNWKKLRPDEISVKMSDSNWRVEGWFRIWVRPDESFNGLNLGISRHLWAATDIYVDGDLVHSFGKTRNPYEAYNPILKYARSIELSTGKNHLIAIHFVDYETAFTPREMRLNPKNLSKLVMLTGPKYNDFITNEIKRSYINGTLSVSISSLLFLLLLLLLLLNHSQKLFQLVTTLNFFVLLASIGSSFSYFTETSYQLEKFIFLFTNSFSLPVMHMFTLIITEWVLKKKTSWITLSILLLMPGASFLGHVFNISWPFGLLNTLMIGYFAYLVISSRKEIKKADWIVVIAMAVLTIGALLFVFLHKYYLESFIEYEQLLKTIVFLSAPIIFLIYISVSYREIVAEREREAQNVIQITNEKKAILEQQKELLEEQVTQRTSELKESLEDLRATQDQLVHSEKMASLGELTAGIAHEIQNPLNFVNNFSEVSVDLIDEMKEEMESGDMEEVNAISGDLKQNLEKITYHGQRASTIVKGMLEHSRAGDGHKELTDVNLLADEYLRLAYHGLKAKDKSFNADFKTDFDENLPKVNAVPQDIGRVLLNLINNAFYACAERSRSTVAEKPKKENKAYEPLVIIKTSVTDNKVMIKVKDNGYGIPEDVKEKIFQPFFTTKPTGEGTGLGLSLSFDIITKGHGGTIDIKSEQGEGSEFTISMPLKTKQIINPLTNN